MSIISVKELYGNRSGGLDNLYHRTYTRQFEVSTSDPKVGWVAVRIASDPSTGLTIPIIGAFYTNGVSIVDPLYEFDHGSFVNSLAGTMDGTPTDWIVTAEYSPWPAGQFDSNPTSWKIRVRFGGERLDKVVDFDKSGVPIKNSAGDRFGDPVVIDDSLRTMVITRNELVSTYDPEVSAKYSNTINNATWNSFATNRCKFGIIETSEEQFDSNNQVWYYTVTYPVSVERTGKVWTKKLLDQGYNILVSGTPTPYMVKGQPVSDPVALNGSGGVLGSGSPVTLEFDVYDDVDWTPLGIDLSLRLGV